MEARIQPVEAVYNNLSEEVSINQAEENHETSREIRLVIALSILFLIFWCPFYFLRLHFEFLKEEEKSFGSIILQLITLIAGYFKSIISPIVILIFYPESRFLLIKLKTQLCL